MEIIYYSEKKFSTFKHNVKSTPILVRLNSDNTLLRKEILNV